jgi:hypothetical protein
MQNIRKLGGFGVVSARRCVGFGGSSVRACGRAGVSLCACVCARAAARPRGAAHSARSSVHTGRARARSFTGTNWCRSLATPLLDVRVAAIAGARRTFSW